MGLCPGHAGDVCLDFWGWQGRNRAWVGATTHVNVPGNGRQQEGCPCLLAAVALKPGLRRSPSSVVCSGVQGWGRGDEAAQAAVRFSPLMVPSGGRGVIRDGCWSLPSQKAALL